MNLLTEAEFKSVLPPGVKKSVNPELMKNINRVLADPNTLDTLRENILGFTSVMKEGRFKMTSYLNAVHYVSHKLLGATNRDAYIKTFPGKYQRFLREGVADKDIASYSTAYNKSKLVALIYEQTLIPIHIINAPILQKAINTQADLMMNAKSEMVRTTAANSLINALKAPETKKVELDIGIKENSVMDDLRRATQDLVDQQKQALIAGGSNAKQIAESSIIVSDSKEE
jgi:hypothetical protein